MKRPFFNCFIKAEDEIIIHSVIEDMKSSSTGKLGIGLWASISKKIPNRSPDYIYDHWNYIMSIDEGMILLLEDRNNRK